jgi:hypothetical protein
MEIWKTILESDLYEISNKGNFRRKFHNNRKLHKNKKGYLNATIYPEGKNNPCICLKIHRLVAQAFLPNPDNKIQVNHKDCNKENNNVDNLEWISNEENFKHAIKNNRLKFKYAQEHPECRFTVEEIEYIRKVYIAHHNIYGCRALARKFKVSHTTIRDIIHNTTYKSY